MAKCQYCDGTFSNKHNLKRHIELFCVKYGQHCAMELARDRCQHLVTERPKVNIERPNVNIEHPNVNIARFPCKTCYKVYETKSGLARHVCERISHPNQCPKCMEILSCASAKSRHVRNCHVARQDVPQTPSSTSITNIQTQTNTNINTQNNIQNIQLQMINVRPLGHEDVSHITNAFKDARLCEFNGKGIYNYIKDVHFNPKLPQNHNVRKHDKDHCNVYDDGEWIQRSLRSVMMELVQTYHRILKDRHYDPEFRLSKTPEDWMSINENLTKFDKKCNPCDYYKTIRDLTDLLEQLEKRYTSTLPLIT